MVFFAIIYVGLLVFVVTVVVAVIMAYYHAPVNNSGVVNYTGVIMVADNYLPVAGATIACIGYPIAFKIGIREWAVNRYFITGLNVVGAVPARQCTSEYPAAAI